MDSNKKSLFELRKLFNQQRQLLTKFCYEFDHGNENIAIIIAGILRTMLHDAIASKNFDTGLIIQSEEMITICNNKHNFSSSKVFRESQRLAGSISSQIKNAHKAKVVSQSLLSLLNGKNISFLDSTIKPKTAIAYYNIASELSQEIFNDIQTKVRSKQLAYLGLCGKEIFIDKKIIHLKYVPLFRHPNFVIDFSKKYNGIKKVPYEEWWNQEVFDNFNGFTLSRKELILSATNLYGYAHVDEKNKPEYEAFKKQDTIHLQKGTMRVFGTYRNIPIYPTIRQICFEFLYTIENELNHLIDNTSTNFFDSTPIGYKLTFECVIDSIEKESTMMNTIFSIKPFIQNYRQSPSQYRKEDDDHKKTIIIHSVSQEELIRIVKTISENRLEIMNAQISQ